MKKQYLFEAIIVVIAFIISAIIYMPKINKDMGSSDKLVLSISDSTNFFVVNVDGIELGVMTDDNKIKTLIFFNPSTMIFYNKNIENKSINDGIDSVINILKNNNYLNNCNIKIINYRGKLDFNKYFSSIGCKIEVESGSLKDLAKDNNISASKDNEILQELYYSSKEYVRILKNATNDNKSKADYVYNKLVNYVETNNIINEDVNSHKLDIIFVPVSKEANNYPTNNSYYYVKDGKVYAYIEININENLYSYCYNGSIDNYKEGKC